MKTIKCDKCGWEIGKNHPIIFYKTKRYCSNRCLIIFKNKERDRELNKGKDFYWLDEHLIK